MDFLIHCKKIQQDLRKLEDYTEQLNKKMKVKQNSVMDTEQEKDLDKQIDTIITKFTDLSNSVKSQIKSSIEETNKLKEKNTNKHVIELRESHTLGHSKKLSKILKKFQSVQYEYRQREKMKLKETFLIACPDATDKQIKDLEDPEKSQKMLESVFALGSHSAKAIINQAMDRKERIEKIVEKIGKLIELINEIDKIVQSNTETVDKIVLSMENAVENTEAAKENLTSARTWQERANTIKRYLTYGGAIFVVGLVIFLAVFFGSKANNSGSDQSS